MKAGERQGGRVYGMSCELSFAWREYILENLEIKSWLGYGKQNWVEHTMCKPAGLMAFQGFCSGNS